MEELDVWERIAQRVVAGATRARRWSLEGGVSSRMHALELVAPDGATQRLVVRQPGAASAEWKPLDDSAARTEHALHQALDGLGLAVPAVRLLDTSSELLDTPYFVMDLVEGTTEVEEATLPDALDRMAAFLVHLHGCDLGAVDLPDLPRRDDPIAETLEHLPPSPMGQRVRQVLEGLGSAPGAGQVALLHGDFWPGNVIWRDGEIAAVIDWEDAALGDPLCDLAGARVELLWRYGAEAMERFTDAYVGSTDRDLARLPYWELLVSGGGLASMGNWGLEPADEARMRERGTWFFEAAASQVIDASAG